MRPSETSPRTQKERKRETANVSTPSSNVSAGVVSSFGAGLFCFATWTETPAAGSSVERRSNSW